MRVAQSLEAVENQETGHGRQRRGSTQTRFPEEEGPETEATRIAEQILAKLIGLSLDRVGTRRDAHPLQGRSDRVRSVDRETSPAPLKDAPKNKHDKGTEKATERNQGRSPSTERSRSRNRDGPPQCWGIPSSDGIPNGVADFFFFFFFSPSRFPPAAENGISGGQTQ